MGTEVSRLATIFLSPGEEGDGWVWGVLVPFSGICFFTTGSGAFGGVEAAEMMRFTAFVGRVWAFRCDLDWTHLALYVPLSQQGTISSMEYGSFLGRSGAFVDKYLLFAHSVGVREAIWHERIYID